MLSKEQIGEVKKLKGAGRSIREIASLLGIREHHICLHYRIEKLGIEEVRRQMREARQKSDARRGPRNAEIEQPHHLVERHVYRRPRQILDRSPTVREVVEAFARGDIARETMLAAYAPGYRPQPGR